MQVPVAGVENKPFIVSVIDSPEELPGAALDIDTAYIPIGC